MGMPPSQPLKAEQFEAERDRLFGLSYRMLGSVADAEDIVQEAWLRFEPATDVLRPAAFLTTVTARLCVDRLRSAQRRRETYVGPWLAEPLLTDRDPSHLVVLDETVRLGFLRVLDRLSAVERAVFLLHDVFDVPYPEISDAVGRSEVNCRQIAHRARVRVRVDRPDLPPNATQSPALLDAFLHALLSGDPSALTRILTEDVVLLSDGGAAQRAARNPIVGAGRVIRFMTNLARRSPAGSSLDVVEVNGHPGIVVLLDGVPVMLIDVEFAGDRVARIHSITNPDKLVPSRQAWIAAGGRDPATDRRVSEPPKMPTSSSRDPIRRLPGRQDR